jgi:hypothetical protein
VVRARVKNSIVTKVQYQISTVRNVGMQHVNVMRAAVDSATTSALTKNKPVTGKITPVTGNSDNNNW